MALTVTLLGVLVVAGLLLVARYGADSRTSGDPTGRDAAWPTGPVREHTPREVRPAPLLGALRALAASLGGAGGARSAGGNGDVVRLEAANSAFVAFLE